MERARHRVLPLVRPHPDHPPARSLTCRRCGGELGPLERNDLYEVTWRDCLECGLIHTAAGEPFGGTLWPLARGKRENREAGLPRKPRGPYDL